MVNMFFTVVSLAILVVAMVTKNENAGVLTTPKDTETEVLSASSQSTQTATAAPVANDTPTGFIMPTPIATASATPIESASPQTLINMNSWVYTGPISEKSVGDAAVSFTSTESAKVLTNWYKDKLSEFGYSTKTVIQTQSLSKVLNKITGLGRLGKALIEITEDSSNSPSHVTVTIDTEAQNIPLPSPISSPSAI